MKKIIFLAFILLLLVCLAACNDEHIHDEVITVTEPTCTEQGYTTHRCTTCWESYVDTYVPAKHNPGADVTCTTAQTCLTCDATINEALGHVASDPATCMTSQICTREGCDYVYQAAPGHNKGDPATCTTAQTCTRNGCNYVYWPALGHIEGNPATCTTAQTCMRNGCNYVYKPELGHIEGDPATCTTEQVCLREECGSVIQTAFGHNYETSRSCAGCGLVRPGLYQTDTHVLLYAWKELIQSNIIKKDWDGQLTDCNNDLHGDLILSDSVTSIGRSAFSYCTSLTSVTIPDGVTSIGDYAFSGCSSLASVSIGNGVITIGRYAFQHCSSLTTVILPNSVTSIGDYAFYGCRSLSRFRYGGTKSQWREIYKGSLWNGYAGNYTIYCIDGTIAKS